MQRSPRMRQSLWPPGYRIHRSLRSQLVPDQTEDCKEWKRLLEKRVLGGGGLETVMEYMGCASREKGISWWGGLAEGRAQRMREVKGMNHNKV